MDAPDIEIDILAYLTVLNHVPIVKKLSHADYLRGLNNVMGCLHRVEDFFKNIDMPETVALINYREKLNGRCFDNNPEFVNTTKKLSEHLFEFLVNSRVGVGVVCDQHKAFLDTLDSELKRILSSGFSK